MSSSKRSPRAPKKAAPKSFVLRRLSVLVVILVLVGIGVGFGAAGGDEGARKIPAVPVTYSVGIMSCTFVDGNRQTPNYATHTTTPGRRLVTEIRYPTVSPIPGATESANANPAKRHGPFPLIVFAHGYNLTPDTYRALLDRWVRAGFVVAAPLFPDTNETAVHEIGDISAGENDDVNQPGDLSFVTSQLIHADEGKGSLCPRVDGLINQSEIGAAGQSDGATTVGMLLYNRTPAFSASAVRFQAGAILSGAEWPWASGTANPYGALPSSPPLLVTQSTTDECNPPQNSVSLYNNVALRNKWFLEISSANHLPPYVGTAPSAFSVVASVTVNFFKMELLGKSFPSEFAHGESFASAGAHLFTGPRAPMIAPLNEVPSTCYLGE